MKHEKAHIKWGITTFLTVCAIMFVYDTFFSTKILLRFGGEFLHIMEPILLGLFIAYLLAPVVNFFEHFLLPHRGQFYKPSALRSHLSRAASLIMTFFSVFMLLYVLLSILLPELYKSLLQLLSNAETYYNTIYHWITDLLEQNPELRNWVTSQLYSSYDGLISWLKGEVLPYLRAWVTAAAGGVLGGVLNVLSFVWNLVIGCIVSVYLLAAKERSAAFCCRLLYSLAGKEKAAFLLCGIKRADSIFSGFVRGKLLDSLIIGILCFVSCSILKMPYTPLISVVVGVTNVIPYFGPFLGAIPSAFLILLVSPKQCLIFSLFILLLQQLDGNFIGPKILGGSTGLSSFWVIVAILFGGGFFGVLGMFFGVPTFACLQTALNYFSARRLEKKGLPTDLDSYRSGGPGKGTPSE